MYDAFNGKREAIVLAGGLGTRLKDAVPDLPKCMAPVAGRPFLYYLINQLRMQNIQRLIFSLGYKHEAILDFLNTEFQSLNFDYVIEEEPLGTGGAIAFAMQKTETHNIFVVNGDTLFKFNGDELLQKHKASGSECTLALKPLEDFERYGVVKINKNNKITSFKEKQQYKEGLINAGVYLINKHKFRQNQFDKEFSFERNYLEKFVNEKDFSGVPQYVYFIDIGISKDFARAQDELELAPFNLSEIDKSWTLFLDRDGVINHDKVGSYIFSVDEFEFMNGVPDLFKKLTETFARIIVITNQRGVGRGLMSQRDLEAIHTKMLKGIEDAGGRIDKIYFATGIDNKDFMRKPNPGMALQAKKDFPEIDFSKSVMVGNNITDMEFARNAGMRTVYLTTTKTIDVPNPYVDLVYKNLLQFAQVL